MCIRDSLDTITYTIGATTGPAIQGNQAASQLQISSSGALTFDIAPDYDLQIPDVQLFATDAFGTETKAGRTFSGYETGATMDFTATVTATDASDNVTTQDITVQVRDVGGADDDTGTGTGAGTGTGTGTNTLDDYGVNVKNPVFTSSATFVVDENVTDIGTVKATIDAAPNTATVTYTIGATTGPAIQGNQASSNLVIDASTGALTFDIAPDYDLQIPDGTLLQN